VDNCVTAIGVILPGELGTPIVHLRPLVLSACNRTVVLGRLSRIMQSFLCYCLSDFFEDSHYFLFPLQKLR
jgi:hypothetical protein